MKKAVFFGCEIFFGAASCFMAWIVEKCNAASLKCHKRRQAAKAGNSKTTKAEG